MKILKKVFIPLLSAVLVFSAVSVFANEADNSDEDEVVYYENDYDNDVDYDDYNGEDYNDGDEADELPPAAVPATFLSFAGEVVEISPVYDNDGEPVYGEYRIEVSGDGTTIFLTNYFTFVLGNEVAVGDEIVGYYEAAGIMALIYPPRHTVRLIVNGDFDNVKIDRFNISEDFDGGLLSEDGQLLLNFTDDTVILLQDGQDFRNAIDFVDRDLMEELDGRTLVVTYGPTTRAIPAQTIPGADGANVEIVVLFEPIAHGPAELAQVEDLPLDADTYTGVWEYTADLDDFDVDEQDIIEGVIEVTDPIFELAVNEIVVNGNRINTNWREIGGVYFVPFRAVVNALGFGDTIRWDGETRSITVHNGEVDIYFHVDGTVLVVGDQELTMDTAPTIINDLTYVPFRFFWEVFGMNNVYHFEGQIVIDNEEPME